MHKKLISVFLFSLILIFALSLAGCTQKLNDLEIEITGEWIFSDFYVLDNENVNTIKYSELDDNESLKLNKVVKDIGDYYSNSTLSLSDKKKNNKLNGTFSKNDESIEIKWWCPNDELKIGFDNLMIYSVQGSITNPIQKAVDLGILLLNENDNELLIGYRTHEFSSYIKFIKK